MPTGASCLTCLLLFQGWYIVTYALGIYHLNLFIAFLSPKVDPSLMEDSGRCRPRAAQGRSVLWTHETPVRLFSV